ncbi:hypothetical protein F5Y15DRAFT_11350 [Xylariaceae sp. FL0016]|nr:hypothetical protein F5Y15DRAFT_11350 [Xylariaceae sp. FL0016]
MSGTASAFAQLKPFSLSSRTVFIKCTPAPVSFYERRAVLKALQMATFESIETFKKLEDEGSFIAITKKPGHAHGLVNDSPFSRTIIAPDPDAVPLPKTRAWGAEFDLSGTIAAPVHPMPTNKTVKSTPASADLGLAHKTFVLHVFPSNSAYVHTKEVKKSPLHGRWPDNKGIETFISSALYKTIPSGHMRPALQDWETGNQLSSDSTNFSGEAREGAAFSLLGKKRISARETFLMERLRRRRDESEVPEVMKSLSGFAHKYSQARKPTSRLESSEDNAVLESAANVTPASIPPKNVS